MAPFMLMAFSQGPHHATVDQDIVRAMRVKSEPQNKAVWMTVAAVVASCLIAANVLGFLPLIRSPVYVFLFNGTPIEVVGKIAILIFSISFHEFKHAQKARELGDHSAAVQARLTIFKFWRHFDPKGLFVFVVSSTLLGLPFGWLKPVQLEALGPEKMKKVAAAGPLASFALAGYCLALCSVASFCSGPSMLVDLLFVGAWLNAALGMVNLLPIAPLDGSHIFGNPFSSRTNLLPRWLRLSGVGAAASLLGAFFLGAYCEEEPLRLFLLKKFGDADDASKDKFIDLFYKELVEHYGKDKDTIRQTIRMDPTFIKQKLNAAAEKLAKVFAKAGKALSEERKKRKEKLKINISAGDADHAVYHSFTDAVGYQEAGGGAMVPGLLDTQNNFDPENVRQTLRNRLVMQLANSFMRGDDSAELAKLVDETQVDGQSIADAVLENLQEIKLLDLFRIVSEAEHSKPPEQRSAVPPKSQTHIHDHGHGPHSHTHGHSHNHDEDDDPGHSHGAGGIILPSLLLAGIGFLGALVGMPFIGLTTRRTVQPQTLDEFLATIPGLGEEDKQFLKFVTDDMTDELKTHPKVYGRSKEKTQIRNRLKQPEKAKKSLILRGRHGVGKSYMMGFIAQEFPEKRIFSLKIGNLGNSSNRNTNLARLVSIMSMMHHRAFLFCDEFHALFQGPNNIYDGQAANTLKPALDPSKITIIGATTDSEFRTYLEPDSALLRRFLVVEMPEPDVADAIGMVRGRKTEYEQRYQVTIPDSAVEASVKGAFRYLPRESLPVSAFDLIEYTISRIRNRSSELNDKKEDFLHRIVLATNDVLRLKKQTTSSDQYQEAHNRLVGSLKAYNEVMQLISQAPSNEQIEISEAGIYESLEMKTGVPVTDIGADEAQKYLDIEATLEKRVVGQTEALRTIASVLRQGKAGLRDPDRPMGVFILAGTTGVGKTELVKAVAEYMFGSDEVDKGLVRLDMTEYMESHNKSRLIGAPPGYVGYEEGGQLTNAVQQHPYCAVLLDEFTKAHRDVFRVLMQVFDEGRLTDGKGELTDFRNTIIFLTSNIGMDVIQPNLVALEKKLNAVETEEAADAIIREMNLLIEQAVMAGLRGKYAPEELARIDKVIIYGVLTKEVARRIAPLVLRKILAPMKNERKVDFDVADSVYEDIVAKGFDLINGARPMRNYVNSAVVGGLTTFVLREMAEGKKINGATVHMKVGADGQYSYGLSSAKATGPLEVDESIRNLYAPLMARIEAKVNSRERTISETDVHQILGAGFQLPAESRFQGVNGPFHARQLLEFEPAGTASSFHNNPLIDDDGIDAPLKTILDQLQNDEQSGLLSSWVEEFVRIAKQYNNNDHVDIAWKLNEEGTLIARVTRSGRNVDAEEETYLRTHLEPDVKDESEARQTAIALGGEAKNIRLELITLKARMTASPNQCQFGFAEEANSVSYWTVLRAPEKKGQESLVALAGKSTTTKRGSTPTANSGKTQKTKRTPLDSIEGALQLDRLKSEWEQVQDKLKAWNCVGGYAGDSMTDYVWELRHKRIGLVAIGGPYRETVAYHKKSYLEHQKLQQRRDDLIEKIAALGRDIPSSSSKDETSLAASSTGKTPILADPSRTAESGRKPARRGPKAQRSVSQTKKLKRLRTELRNVQSELAGWDINRPNVWESEVDKYIRTRGKEEKLIRDIAALEGTISRSFRPERISEPQKRGTDQTAATTPSRATDDIASMNLTDVTNELNRWTISHEHLGGPSDNWWYFLRSPEGKTVVMSGSDSFNERSSPVREYKQLYERYLKLVQRKKDLTTKRRVVPDDVLNQALELESAVDSGDENRSMRAFSALNLLQQQWPGLEAKMKSSQLRREDEDPAQTNFSKIAWEQLGMVVPAAWLDDPTAHKEAAFTALAEMVFLVGSTVFLLSCHTFVELTLLEKAGVLAVPFILFLADHRRLSPKIIAMAAFLASVYGVSGVLFLNAPTMLFYPIILVLIALAVYLHARFDQPRILARRLMQDKINDVRLLDNSRSEDVAMVTLHILLILLSASLPFYLAGSTLLWLVFLFFHRANVHEDMAKILASWAPTPNINEMHVLGRRYRILLVASSFIYTALIAFPVYITHFSMPHLHHWTLALLLVGILAWFVLISIGHARYTTFATRNLFSGRTRTPWPPLSARGRNPKPDSGYYDRLAAIFNGTIFLECVEQIMEINMHLPEAKGQQGFWEHRLDTLAPQEIEKILRFIFSSHEKEAEELPGLGIIYLNDTPFVITVDGLNGRAHALVLTVPLNPETLSVVEGHLNRLWHSQNRRVQELEVDFWLAYIAPIPKTTITTFIFNGVKMFSYSSTFFLMESFLPRAGSTVWMLDCGSGIGEIHALFRNRFLNQGIPSKVILSNASARDAVNTLLNVRMAGLDSVVDVAHADMFDAISSETRIDEVVLDPPVPALPGSDFYSQADTIKEADKDMRYMRKFLQGVGPHLNDGGVINMVYSIAPEVIDLIFQSGFEPMAITARADGVLESAPMFGRVVITLVRANSSFERTRPLDQLKNDWHALSEFTAKARKGELRNGDLAPLEQMRDRLFADLKQRGDFNGLLLFQEIELILGRLGRPRVSNLIGLPLMAVNELYRDHIHIQHWGRMGKVSEPWLLDDFNPDLPAQTIETDRLWKKTDWKGLEKKAGFTSLYEFFRYWGVFYLLVYSTEDFSRIILMILILSPLLYHQFIQAHEIPSRQVKRMGMMLTLLYTVAFILPALFPYASVLFISEMLILVGLVAHFKIDLEKFKKRQRLNGALPVEVLGLGDFGKQALVPKSKAIHAWKIRSMRDVNALRRILHNGGISNEQLAENAFVLMNLSPLHESTFTQLRNEFRGLTISVVPPEHALHNGGEVDASSALNYVFTQERTRMQRFVNDVKKRRIKLHLYASSQKWSASQIFSIDDDQISFSELDVKMHLIDWLQDLVASVPLAGNINDTLRTLFATLNAIKQAA